MIQTDIMEIKEYDSVVEYAEELKRNLKIKMAVLIDTALKEVYLHDGRKSTIYFEH